MLIIGGPAAAEWPESIEVGGFAISQIKGSTNPDGSGRATGKIAIPDAGTPTIDLVKSGSGVVTGSMRSRLAIRDVRIDGSFMLDRSGLQGTGTVHTQGRPVQDANLVIDAKSGVKGKGRVRLGQKLVVPVEFVVSRREISLSGSAPCEVSIDTPLAIYKFKGDVVLSVAGIALRTKAAGIVERRGKIGGMVSTFGPLSFEVDPSSGKGNLNVGGATISVDLW
ncbi:MAG: hypothetical protein HYX78_14175 [Armatimonadetes bacterium]|nr:hypothetical protein [Armatimonadota bacterium]